MIGKRLLYYVSSGNRKMVADCMEKLKEDGRYTVCESVLEKLNKDFVAYYCDEAQTRGQIRKTYEEHKYLIDPHTAVGMAVAEKYLKETEYERHTVVLSTASPYKFTAVELDALGILSTGSPFEDMHNLKESTGAEIPQQLLDLENAEERFADVINSDELTDYVINFVKKGGLKQ